MLPSLDPNILSPFQLLEPWISSPASLTISIVSIILSLAISWNFFKSYRFSGFGYLLGLPTGFILLALSFAFQHLSLAYQSDFALHPAFFWLQIVFQSEGFALMAVSYRFKDFQPKLKKQQDQYSLQSSRENRANPTGALSVPVRLRDIALSIAPLAMVTIPFVAPASIFAETPYFNYPRIADLGFCMVLFNMGVIAYIFKSVIVSLVRAGNIKLLYIPAAFALFFLEQYSLTITYFDNSVIALIGSMVARMLALSLFVYMMRAVAVSSRRLEVEAREKA